jgi:hypothetical protein
LRELDGVANQPSRQKRVIGWTAEMFTRYVVAVVTAAALSESGTLTDVSGRVDCIMPMLEEPSPRAESVERNPVVAAKEDEFRVETFSIRVDWLRY